MNVKDNVNETEQLLLSACLKSTIAADEAFALVRPDYFRSDSHQTIAKTIMLFLQQGTLIDLVSIADMLQTQGMLESIGGYSYLAKLYPLDPTGANAAHHAELVRGYYLRRSVHRVAGELQHLAVKPDRSPSELLEHGQAMLGDIDSHGTHTGVGSIADAVDESVMRLEKIESGEITPGYRTKWCDIDLIISGLVPSELTVIAARPSVGKTAIALGLAQNLSQQGIPILFVSLEQPRQQLADRLISAIAGVDGLRIKAGRIGRIDAEKINDATKQIRTWPITISDDPKQTVYKIGAVARSMHRKNTLGVVIIDYLQLIEPRDRKTPRYEQVGEISKSLKALARTLNVPVVSLAQLNRSSDDRGKDSKPRLSDLRESGNIEQDADVVWLLSRDADNEKKLLVDVAKHRNGPIGEAVLLYDRMTQQFTNCAENQL